MDTILFFHTSLREAWRKKLAGVYRHARVRGWRVQVVEPQGGDKPPPVRELVKFWKPAGCIAECSGRGGDRFRPDVFGRLPTVFLGSDPAALPPGASCVSPAPEGVGERAAREFLEAGLENFAFVATSGDSFWSRDREADFARALALHGRRCEVFGRDGGRTGDGAARAAALSAWLKALPKPCGLLAENDYAAAEVLDLARRARVRVPEALAVIGVDNDPALCENARPTLTSVALDFERAGYRASEILDSLVRGGAEGAPPPPVRETYPVLGVARRGSTPTGLGVPPRVHKALAFIRERAFDGISAADVAARMPGSRRTAETEFRRFAGRGIYEEIMAVRFERAELLLRDRYRDIGAIAGLCGWKSENALRAAFRKKHGVSMSEWRREHAAAASPPPYPTDASAERGAPEASRHARR